MKTYVDVIAYITKEGRVKPLYIVWEDSAGERPKYKIDRITYHYKNPNGHQIFNVVISGQEM